MSDNIMRVCISHNDLKAYEKAAVEYKKEKPAGAQKVLESLPTIQHLTWEHLAIMYAQDVSKAGFIKTLNGNEEKPADLMNFTQSIFCAISDSYCEIKGVKVQMAAPKAEPAPIVEESKSNTKETRSASKPAAPAKPN
ncbi:MAG: hypothetical protein ABIJ26_01110, partial [Candidatus Margulisiibacteriota bacterium]